MKQPTRISRHNSQAGFGPLEILIVIIVVCALLGGAIFLGMHNQTKQPSDQPSTTTGSTTPKTTTPSAKDYTTYTNTSLGFSFAYPKAWGAITASNNTAAPAIGATPVVTSKSYPFHYGTLNFAIKAKSDYQITGQTHGATYVPVLKNSSYSNYVWKVVSVDPADITDKVGDIYEAPTRVSNSGVQLYDFNYSDSGVNTKRWSFETKAGFVTLAMPAYGPSTQHQPTAADDAAQLSIANAIAASVQLIY